MDKVSRKILKAVKESPDSRYMFYVDIIPFEGIAPTSEVESAIKYLVNEKYLNEIFRHGKIVGVTLAHKSFHRKYFAWLSIKHFLIHNIIAIIALIVAVITLINDLGLITLPVIK